MLRRLAYGSLRIWRSNSLTSRISAIASCVLPPCL